jgi:TPR repeat protein
MCDGCVYAHQDATDELGVENSCPFCRESANVPVSENIKRTEKRMKLGDCNAFCMLGGYYLQGMPPLKRNTKKGLELLNQAAELGSESAHHTLGVSYGRGTYLKKDTQKAWYHLRLAAIGGMAESRCALGLLYLPRDLNMAYKHFIIAAEAGHDKSLKEVKTGYAKGHVEKDVFEKVLRAHQAAKDSVKSEARDKADSRRRQAGTGRHDPHSRILVRDL